MRIESACRFRRWVCRYFRLSVDNIRNNSRMVKSAAVPIIEYGVTDWKIRRWRIGNCLTADWNQVVAKLLSSYPSVIASRCHSAIVNVAVITMPGRRHRHSAGKQSLWNKVCTVAAAWIEPPFLVVVDCVPLCVFGSCHGIIRRINRLRLHRKIRQNRRKVNFGKHAERRRRYEHDDRHYACEHFFECSVHKSTSFF